MNTKINLSLKDIISHAYREVEYYRLLFDACGIDKKNDLTMQDFEQIPFLTRDELQKDESRFLAERYQFFPWNEKLELRRTLSSKGHMMKIYWDSDNNSKSRDCLSYLREEWRNISQPLKVCSFTVHYMQAIS